MERIRDLRGLGAKSEESLAQVGIRSVDDLRAIGPVMAFYRLRMRSRERGEALPSMNFLYALVGALSDRPWQEVARSERADLLNQIHSFEEMERLFA